jgi:hypothetical protein
MCELTFLDQLGADPTDPRIQRACDYVLAHSQASSGGFGSSGAKNDRPPPPSRVIHCLNGNLLCALIDFGRLESVPDSVAASLWRDSGEAT